MDTATEIAELKEEQQRLLNKIKQLEDDPKNRNPPGELQRYTKSCRIRTDKMRMSVTHLSGRIRALQGNPVPCNGYSGRQTNRR